MTKNEIKVFSPATIANVSSGFDVMGLALEGVGDTLIMRKTKEKGTSIKLIEGAELPMDADKNVASYVASLMLKKAKVQFGIEIEIYKGIIGGSGLGSSASSCAAAAVGTNYFLNNKFSINELIAFSAEGEKLICGSPITDNVAPAIMGGIIFIQNPKDKNFISIPIPEDLHIVVIHPQIEVTTEESRALVKKMVPLTTVTKQMANFGGLLVSLFNSDYALMKQSMVDYLAEPYRHCLIQGFTMVRETALTSGAIGGGISGSGPSIFHFCEGKICAEKVYKAIDKEYKKLNIPYKMYFSKVNAKGTYIID